jgi:putative effector of murein hydrolase
MIFDCFAIIILTIAAFYLYFWTGKKILKNTQNMKINLFFTVVLVILILGIIGIAYDSFGGTILRISLFPIVETLSYFLQIDNKFIYMILSPLPSLLMLAGMRAKLKKFRLPWHNNKEGEG